MLSVLEIKALRSKEKDYTVRDSDNLSLRVLPSGAKIWIFRKKVGSKSVKKTLGEFPALSVKEARLLRDKELNREVKTIVTLEDAYLRWIELKKTQIKNYRDIEKRFEKYILPVAGTKSLDDLTPPVVISILQTIADAGRLETVKRLCSWIKQLEIFCLNGGYINTLKLQNLSSQFISPKATHLASIAPKDLPEIFKALNSLSPIAYTLTLVAFYTLLRPSEYLNLRWSWLKKDYIEVPAEYMKMKRAHRVPLTPQLKALLGSTAKSSDYIFYSRITNSAYTIELLEKAFRRAGLRGVLVPHGIRAIGRSWFAQNNVDFIVAEHCLAHASGSKVVQSYQRYDYLAERAKVMRDWCEYVDMCRA